MLAHLLELLFYCLFFQVVRLAADELTLMKFWLSLVEVQNVMTKFD